jgi:hypothetical protein
MAVPFVQSDRPLRQSARRDHTVLRIQPLPSHALLVLSIQSRGNLRQARAPSAVSIRLPTQPDSRLVTHVLLARTLRQTRRCVLSRTVSSIRR